MTVVFSDRSSSQSADYLIGFSSPERWGCWIVGIPAVIGLRSAIRGRCRIDLVGGGFGGCLGTETLVIVGAEEHGVCFTAGPTGEPQTVTLEVNLDRPVWQITLVVPTLTSPGNGDPRLLGIGLCRLEIQTGFAE